MRFSSPARRRRKDQRFSQVARFPAKPAVLRIAAGMLGLALVAGAGAGAVVSASATELTSSPEATATLAANVPAAAEQAPATPVPAPSAPQPQASRAPAPTEVPAPAEVPTSAPTPTKSPAAAAPTSPASIAPAAPTSAAAAPAATPALKAAPAVQALAAADPLLTCASGVVYTIDSGGQIRQVSTTGAQTNMGSFTGEDLPNLNGFALTKDAGLAYAVRVQPDSDGDLTVYQYNPATGQTAAFAGAQNINGSQTFVMGGINPVNGFYYYGRINSNYLLEIYAFNTSTKQSVGKVGTVNVGTDNDENRRGNGDLVFSSDGKMYFVASSGEGRADSNVIMRVDSVPTTSGSGNLVSTVVTRLTPRDQKFNGIAFAGGFLYLDTSDGHLYKVDASTGLQVGNGAITKNLSSPVDMASCQYNNSLQVQKNIVSRVASTDQFTMSATVNNEAIGSSGTTTGSTTGSQTEPGTFASSIPTSGTTITIQEVGVSDTNLAQYSSSWVCKNQSGTQIANGSGTSGTFVFPPQTGDGVNVTCEFTNRPLSAQVTVTKTWVNPVASDTASFSANTATGTSTASANGTVITTTFAQGTRVTVAEVLGSANKGIYSSALICTNAAGTTVATGVLTGSFVLGTSNVTCAFTNTNAPATVVVAKKWIVDGRAYDNGQQPAGISAALTLNGPGTAGASGQGWGAVRSLYFAGNTVSITEATSFASPLTCQVKSSRLTLANGTTTSLALPHVATLAAGANSYTITNTVECTTELTLLKFIDNRNGGSLVPGDFTLTAKPAGGTAWNVTGANSVTAANTESVTPGVSHTVSESSALKPAYLQLSLQRYTGTLNADGSLANPNAWADADPTTVRVATGHHEVYRFVNASVPALALPLTGGTGTSAYTIAGGGLLLLAIFTTGWIVFRRIRANRP